MAAVLPLYKLAGCASKWLYATCGIDYRSCFVRCLLLVRAQVRCKLHLTRLAYSKTLGRQSRFFGRLRGQSGALKTR